MTNRNKNKAFENNTARVGSNFMISNNFITEAVPLTNKSPTSRLNKRSSRLSFN
jgi:hypothetical protein